MDDQTFDRIARRIEMLTSRRSTLSALAGAGLLAALGGSRLDVEAKRKKKKKKTCKPESISATCGARCGSVKNNCKQTVQCGSCAVCARCDSSFCEVDPDQVGDPCGQTGQVCNANGTCACNATSCGLGQGCFDGVCEDCGETDEQCCPGPVDACVGLRNCVSGTCKDCGFIGGQCCDDAPRCLPNGFAGCFEEGICEECGEEGQQCCTPDDTCSFGFLTCNNGTCVS